MKMDITPTPRGYAQMLLAILENAERTKQGREARQWARDEIVKVVVAASTINPDAWGKENE
jgi:hypothetical protein